jgi:hypothetical protein
MVFGSFDLKYGRLVKEYNGLRIVIYDLNLDKRYRLKCFYEMIGKRMLFGLIWLRI